MTTTTTIPITVAPDAAAHVAELGMEAEFNAMLEHTKETVPGLWAIEVTLDDNPDEPDYPGVVIHARRTDPGPGDDPTNRQWGAWFVRTFPPEVFTHFCMLSWYGSPDEG